MTRLPSIDDEEALALLPPKEAGNIRLLHLAALLDTVSDYDQWTFYYGAAHDRCGSPACALGHWAAANAHRGWLNFNGCPARRDRGWLDLDAELKEFHLTQKEADSLFGASGCGRAGNDAHAAAAYIRGFVEKRRSR